MYKTQIFSFLVILVMIACKEKPKSVTDVAAEPVDSSTLVVPPPQAPFSIEKMNMKDIEKHEIMKQGCLCKLSDDTSSNFLYADDQKNMAVLKYDGILTRYLAVEAEKVDGDHVTKEFKNTIHTIKFEGNRSKDPKSDAGSILNGSLKVFDNKGILIVEKKVSGPCSC